MFSIISKKSHEHSFENIGILAHRLGISTVEECFLSLESWDWRSQFIQKKHQPGQLSAKRNAANIYRQSDHELFHLVITSLFKRQVQSIFVTKMYICATSQPNKVMVEAAVVYTQRFTSSSLVRIFLTWASLLSSQANSTCYLQLTTILLATLYLTTLLPSSVCLTT